MNALPSDPVRLKDQFDQPALVERIASQTARDLAQLPALSAAAAARIAATVRSRRSAPHRPPRLTWALVLGGLLLGMGTVASAAYLDLLPRWVTGIVQSTPDHSAQQAGPSKAKPRPAPDQTQAHPSPISGPAAAPVTPAVTQEPVRPTAPAPASAGPGSAPTAPLRGTLVLPAKVARGETVTKPRSVALLEDEHERQPDVENPFPTTTKAAHARGESAHTTEPLASAILETSRVPMERAAPAPERPAREPETALPTPQNPAPAAPATARANEPSLRHQTATHLKEIVRTLRIDHSPSRALELLDEHAQELADNAFAGEALMLRVEALLALGRRNEALRLLDDLSAADLTAHMLAATRGELRAAANRCAEAVGDFDLVLRQSHSTSRLALLGRARCRQQLGDAAGAALDLDRYRREFPEDPQH